MSIGLRVALTTVFGLTTLCISSLASAQWYVGGSAGRSTTSFHTSDFSLNLPAFISENQDKNKSAYKLFGGYDFNKNWAVEGGYTDLGKPQYNYAVYAGPQAGNTGQTIVKESAWSIAAKGAFPINNQFNVFGKLGLTYNKAEGSANSTSAAINTALGLPATRSKSRSEALFGLGGQYNLTQKVGLRLEYEDYGKFGDSTGSTKVNMWSLGMAYKF